MSSGVTTCGAAPESSDPQASIAIYTFVSTASLPSRSLVEAHLPMARTLAGQLHRRVPARVGLDELESDAVYGLMEAARGFDASRGVSFRTYAGKCIRHAMWQGLKQRHHLQDLRSIETADETAPVLSDQIESAAPAPEHAAEVKDQVHHLLKHLEPKLRSVAQGLLRGLSGKQIAKELGIATSTVFQRLSEIRQVAEELGIRND
jgi:RNA polymerase sigma factor (sigma-70 family)